MSQKFPVKGIHPMPDEVPEVPEVPELTEYEQAVFIEAKRRAALRESLV